jgi:hypothetical protein
LPVAIALPIIEKNQQYIYKKKKKKNASTVSFGEVEEQY